MNIEKLCHKRVILIRQDVVATSGQLLTKFIIILTAHQNDNHLPMLIQH